MRCVWGWGGSERESVLENPVIKFIPTNLPKVSARTDKSFVTGINENELI